MKMLEYLARTYGFNDSSEMTRLIASVDLSTPEMRERFKNWQIFDGTKEGLQKLLKWSPKQGQE